MASASLPLRRAELDQLSERKPLKGLDKNTRGTVEKPQSQWSARSKLLALGLFLLCSYILVEKTSWLSRALTFVGLPLPGDDRAPKVTCKSFRRTNVIVLLISESVAPSAFSPLPLGSIKPLGWIEDQMRLMSAGLAGHQYDFYHVVQHSPWLGGHSEYSPLQEGLPYWFNGLVPLAYGLNDLRLIRQVEDASDYVLNHQKTDGWLGPEQGSDRDLWGRFPFLLGLIQQAEAEPARANRIVPAIYKFVNLMHSMLINGKGLKYIWGRVRYQDMIITLQWLYENYPEDNAQILIETMYLLKQHGLDWTSYWTESNYIFEDLDLVQPPIKYPTPRFGFTHGVNAVQGLKAAAVLYRFNQNQSLIQTSRDAVNWTFTYHGDPAGSVIGDERESGTAPNRGSELCTTTEAMYSLSYLYQMFGDRKYADQCELAAFNALPVSITSDHWARQYLALPNEPFSKRLSRPTPFWNVGPDGIIYGLEPNYPCCTVNMPQGLPKYLSASYVRVDHNGIGHTLLGPAEVSTKTKAGTIVRITCNTTYPFGSNLDYEITSSAAFTLFLRVPEWADLRTSYVEVNGNGAENPVQPNQHTGMTSVVLSAGTNTISYRLGASIRVEPRGNGSVSIYHGALLYALDVGQTTSHLLVTLYNQSATYPKIDGPPQVPAQAHDLSFENTKPWNIAIDPSTLQFHTSSDSSTVNTLKNPIFDYEAPPSYITGQGCQINWGFDRGLPAALPKLPKGAIWNCTSNVTDVIFRP